MEFLKENLQEYQEICMKAHHLWDELMKSVDTKEDSIDFYKRRVFDFIWESNCLESTLSNDACKREAGAVLMKIIDTKDTSKATMSTDTPKPTAIQQLVNHLNAYFCLCHKDSATQQLPVLSEELIKHTHGVMMQGLDTDDGTKVNAGVYRTMSVYAGEHAFPLHKCVPANMARIVAEYESKATHDHNPFQLASWLFFQVVSLHPFEDGNGRLSRILWCYSLMRDGLPFPVVLTSGHRRSQKHLVRCLEHDRRLSAIDQPHLTALSIVSVWKAWDSFLDKNKLLIQEPL